MNSFFQTFAETVFENRVKLISIFIIGLVIKKLFEPILEKIILFLWFILKDWFDSSVNLFDDKSYWKYMPDDNYFLEELKKYFNEKLDKKKFLIMSSILMKYKDLLSYDRKFIFKRFIAGYKLFEQIWTYKNPSILSRFKFGGDAFIYDKIHSFLNRRKGKAYNNLNIYILWMSYFPFKVITYLYNFVLKGKALLVYTDSKFISSFYNDLKNNFEKKVEFYPPRLSKNEMHFKILENWDDKIKKYFKNEIENIDLIVEDFKNYDLKVYLLIPFSKKNRYPKAFYDFFENQIKFNQSQNYWDRKPNSKTYRLFKPRKKPTLKDISRFLTREFKRNYKVFCNHNQNRLEYKYFYIRLDNKNCSLIITFLKNAKADYDQLDDNQLKIEYGLNPNNRLGLKMIMPTYFNRGRSFHPIARVFMSDGNESNIKSEQFKGWAETPIKNISIPDWIRFYAHENIVRFVNKANRSFDRVLRPILFLLFFLTAFVIEDIYTEVIAAYVEKVLSLEVWNFFDDLRSL